MYPDRYRSPRGYRYARSLLIDWLGGFKQGMMQEAGYIQETFKRGGYQVCLRESSLLNPVFQAQGNRFRPLAQISGDLSSIRTHS